MIDRPSKLGQGSGSDFIARIDPEAAAGRFRNTLEHEAGVHSDDISDGFEVAGAIKWFDASKGYGFIVPDNDMSDVLVSVHELRDGVVPSQWSDGETKPGFAQSQWEPASVTSFDAMEGYGILALERGGPPIHCNIEVVCRFGLTELRPGQRLQIRWREGENGPTVVEMRPGDERHQ